MLDRKIRYCSLPEAIREHFLWGARSIVIAGTHGKTTTTSLAGWLLTHGGADPSVLVGGIARNFGEHGSSYRIGQGRDFVIEGDEYDSAFFDKTAKFLKYLPDIAVINNVEFDHADIYADFDAVTLAFRRLVNLVPRPAAADRRRQRGGAGPEGRRRLANARDVRDPAPTSTGRRTISSRPAPRRGSRCGAAVGIGQLRGAAGRARTTSATRWRRLPWRPRSASAPNASPRGCARLPASSGGSKSSAPRAGVTVYDDFAHHPTAVAETLAGLRAANPDGAHLGGVRAALRPRRAGASSRTTSRARLPGADEVVLAPVFRSTLPEAERLSIPDLVHDLGPRANRRVKRNRSTTSSAQSSANIAPAIWSS